MCGLSPDDRTKLPACLASPDDITQEITNVGKYCKTDCDSKTADLCFLKKWCGKSVIKNSNILCLRQHLTLHILDCILARRRSRAERYLPLGPGFKDAM